MRIHELLESSLEWISHDGALGCDPGALQQYLATRHAGVDDSYFAHIWSCLVQHPSIEVVSTRHPLPRPDGTILLGTTPLPDDYVPPPDSGGVPNLEELYSQGMRGRQIAYQLAGLEYRTSKQAIRDNKQLMADRKVELGVEKRAAASNPAAGKGKGKQKGSASDVQDATSAVAKKGKGKAAQGAEDAAELIRILRGDDGDPDAPILLADLPGLTARWGSRLRIRCTDAEVYYRLTGSHGPIPKMSSQVLFILQAAARSRDAGITTLDLGPLLGTSQGSISYFIGVLLDCSLIHKYRTALNGTSSNYIVFHKYAEQHLARLAGNSRRPPPKEQQPTEEPTSASVENIGDDGEDDTGPTIDQTPMADLDFSPISEHDMMLEMKLKERLVQLLDHPCLENHLLKNKNLLRLLGWQGVVKPRHRRALLRQQKTMIAQGILERLQVGPEGTICLRLTKYGSEELPMAKRVEEGLGVQTNVGSDGDRGSQAPILPQDYDEPFNPLGGIPLTMTVEHQMLRLIIAAGRRGRTIGEIRDDMRTMFKRAVESLVTRFEANPLPPHLLHYGIAPTMEFEGKEKRLRYYGIAAFRQVLEEQGQVVDEAKHPLPGPEAGRWADLTGRAFWRHRAILDDVFDQGDLADLEYLPTEKGGATALLPRPKARKKKAPPRKPAVKKETLYDDDVQSRGRPRKYLYVVNENGKVNRLIIGNVIPGPGVPPVWIFVAHAHKLVEAPRGYTGLGVPPAITDEQLKDGKDPEWFDQFERVQHGAKAFKHQPRKGKAAVAKTAKKRHRSEDAQSELDDGTGDDGLVVVEDEPATQDGLSGRVDEGMRTVEADLQRDVTATDAVPPVEAPPAPPTPTNEMPESKRRRGRTTRAQAVTASQRELAATQVDQQNNPHILEDPPAIDVDQAETVVTTPSAPPLTRSMSKRGRPKMRAQAAPEDAPPSKRMRLDSEASASAPREDGLLPQRDRSESVALREITPDAQQPVSEAVDRKPDIAGEGVLGRTPAKPRGPIVRNGRIDLYAIRRQNELCQVLSENGGVLDKAALYTAHTAWVKRVAGTDHPHAPKSPASMDRSVYHRTVKTLLDSDRMNETKASMVYNTKWTTTAILYLPETPRDVVQSFIRSLASMTSQAMSNPARKSLAKPIPAARFTEIKLESTPVAPQAPATPIDTPVAMTPMKSLGETRREILLSQPGIGAFLYGFQSGRFARAESLHKGLIEAMSSGRRCSSLLSSATDGPRIFAMPLMFEDFPTHAFFASILVPHYDEGLEKWVRDPEHRHKPISEIPAAIRPPAAFAGWSYRTRVLAVFGVLAELGLITPLILRDAQEPADIVCQDDQTGCELSFSFLTDKDSQAAYFMLNDRAPIYHVAADDQKLLGVLPVRTAEEADTFWTSAKQASVEPDPTAIAELPPLSDTDVHSRIPISQTGSISSELVQTLRHRARWSPDIRLVQIQREALQGCIDWEQGRLLVTGRAEIERLAWENALPLPFVDRYLSIKGQQAVLAAQERRRHARAAAKLQRQRQEKSRADLRRKLEQRRAEVKRAWEERVASVAAKEGQEFSVEMSEYVRTHTLVLTRREALTDGLLAELIRMYKRAKDRGEVFDPQLRRTGTYAKLPKVPKKVVVEPLPDGRRRRRRWTAEEDETLLDCEAILVARAGGRRGAGRGATSQVLPDTSVAVLGLRLKKVMDMPGQQAYFDKLVTAWTRLWLEYRGTDLLPDDNYESINGLDMAKHLAFLRERVDKAVLRSSVSVEAATSTIQPAIMDLPLDVATLSKQYSVITRPYAVPNFTTSIENAISDDARFAIMSGLSLLDDPAKEAEMHESRTASRKEDLRSAIKMVVATPDDGFDAAKADQLMQAWTEEERTETIDDMIRERVLYRRTHHNATGRGYAFTQNWLQACEGPLSQELFTDARTARAAMEQPDGTEWSITGKGGNVAALLEMVSQDKVDLSFDLEAIPSLHHHRQKYNTRRMNDDYFEFPFRVHALEAAPPSIQNTETPSGDPVVSRFARWRDIHGRIIEAEWRKALDCAVGSVLQRPGMTERALREALVPTLERSETSEVLDTLLRRGLARRSWIMAPDGTPLPALGNTDAQQEGNIAWWPLGVQVFRS